MIRNETLDEVEPEPVKLLQGLAMELSETLKKEAVEVKKEENFRREWVDTVELVAQPPVCYFPPIWSPLCPPTDSIAMSPLS